MGKTKKIVITMGISITTLLGTIGLMQVNNVEILDQTIDSHIQAYNYKPANVLDNVFEKDGITILPFILKVPRTGEKVISTSEVRSQIEQAGETIISITKENYLATGDVIKTNKNTYNVVIYGDVDRDGIVDAEDAAAIKSHFVLRGDYELTGLYKIAANVDNDTEDLDMFDVARILRFCAGTEEKLVLNEPESLKEQEETVSISVETTKTEYKYNEDLDMSKITVKRMTNLGKEEIVSSGYAISGYDKRTLGNQTVIITYKGKQARFNVNVINYVKGIEKQTNISNSEYVEGDNLDLTGIVLKKVMANDARENLSISDVNITPKTNIPFGTEKVQIVYTTQNTINDAEKSFKIEIPINVRKLDVNATDKVTIFAEIPSPKPDNVVIKNGKIYTLLPIKLKGIQEEQDKIIKADEFILGEPTTEKPFGVTYTGYESEDEANRTLDIEMFKDEEIVTTGDADSIGIALNSQTVLNAKQLNIKYKNSSKEALEINAELLSISQLIITPTVQIPELINHERMSIGTITSGDGQKKLETTNLGYKIENEIGENITASSNVTVEFIEEDEIIKIYVTVEDNKSGNYFIVPYLKENENINTKQEIDSINHPDITTIEMESNTEIITNNPVKNKIVFKNKYNDELNIKKDELTVDTTNDVDAEFMTTVVDGIEKVTDIQITVSVAGDKTITIKKNGNVVGRPITFTVKEANIGIDTQGITSIPLFETEPIDTTNLPEGIKVSSKEFMNEETGEMVSGVFTLIPISLTGTGIDIVGSDIEDAKLSYSISNNDDASILIKLFDEQGEIISDGTQAIYIGFASSEDYTVAELNGIKITLTYEDSAVLDKPLTTEITIKND